MRNFTFIPQGDAGKELWLKNLAAKLPQYASKYNITADELADITNSSISFTYWLDKKNQVDEYNKKLTAFKNELRDGIEQDATPSLVPVAPPTGVIPMIHNPGIFNRAASVGHRIKRHYAYTIADGKDLGLEVASASKLDLQTVKPVIKVRQTETNKVEVIWTKGKMDGVEIFVDRGEGYEFLVFDLHPNYTDSTQLEDGQTAVWKYQAVYNKGDVRVGQFSDEVSITVTGKK